MSAPARRRPPHLVYLAIGFPPAAKSCAYRMRATANLFREEGWEVTAVTIDDRSWDLEYGLDPSLLDLVDPEVRRVQLPLRRIDLDPDIRTYSWARARSPHRWQRWHRRMDQWHFPEQVFGRWLPGLTEGTRRTVQSRPTDLILVSAGPYVTLAAAWRAARACGVPLAVDYRDGWSIDVLTGHPAFSPNSRRGRLESRYLSTARSVWTVNEPIRDFYRGRYPALADKFTVARNGFDADLGSDLAVRRLPRAGEPLRFGYLGTVNFQPVMLQAILSGWRQAREQEPALADATLEFRGHLGAGMAKAANANARLIADHAAAGVSYGGPVAKSAIPATYRDWDALVLALAGGGFVTSGKVYEYMASGLPILSAHAHPHAANDVLTGYPLWTPPTELTEQALRDGFAATARQARGATAADRQRALDHAVQFERGAQLRPAVRALADSITTRPVPVP